MGWIKPGDYTRNNINKAGEIVIEKKKVETNSKEEIEAFNTFNNWRASHAYPLHIIMMTLKKISKKISPEAICVQRLKRRKSVIIKLIRFPKMGFGEYRTLEGVGWLFPMSNQQGKWQKNMLVKIKGTKESKQENIIISINQSQMVIEAFI